MTIWYWYWLSAALIIVGAAAIVGVGVLQGTLTRLRERTEVDARALNLTLESVTYRFGIRQNATLRGDSIYYVPGLDAQTTRDATKPLTEAQRQAMGSDLQRMLGELE